MDEDEFVFILEGDEDIEVEFIPAEELTETFH